MEIITLQTKEQLDIFMNPQRQKLLRILEKSHAPLTPKALSIELGVSASSVQHHLKKLESLGLARLDHKAVIRGINAKYYVATRATVHIGREGEASLQTERAALLKMLVAEVLDDTVKDLQSPSQNEIIADVLTGVAHLAPERMIALQGMIRDFLKENQLPSNDTQPCEYALIYRRAGNAK